MTAPTVAGVTTPYTIADTHPVRITDGANNSPAGLSLVNRADNGGTIWVQSGPAGSAGAVPLGPGGTLQWTDAVNLPYAFLSPSATKPETLVVTNQAQGYSNPITVAQQLIAQGVPSTMLDTDYGSYQLGTGQATPAVAVGASSTLIVSVNWPQSNPVGSNVLRVRFDDPASPNFTWLDYFLTAPNGVSQENWTWQIPVMAPTVTFTNVQPWDNNNSPCYVDIVGNNRPSAGLQMLDSTQPGGAQLWANIAATGGGTYELMGGAHTGGTGSSQPAAYSASGSRCTRLTGACTAAVWVNSSPSPTAVYLYQSWINAQGQPVSMAYPVTPLTAGAGTVQLAHPPVPCYWRLFANSGSSTTIAQVFITQN